VLEVVDKSGPAVGQLGDCGAGAALGVVDEGRASGVVAVDTPLGDEFADPTQAESVCGDLSHQVAAGLVGRAHVHEQQREQIRAQLPTLDELDRGNPHTFLEDLGGVGGHRSRGQPADVDVVGHVRHHGGEFGTGEYRGDEAGVGQVRTAEVRIVGDQDIARGQGVGTDLGERVPDQRRHQPEVQRNVLCLRDQLASGAVDPGGAVATVLDVRRVGGTDEGRTDLFSDGLEAITRNLQVDRAEGRGGAQVSHGASSAWMCRKPC
jgi:hypothetical protein